LSIANAVFDRSFKNIVVAVLVVFLYGGMIYGVLPSGPTISFEGHLFGAVAGIACAFLLKRFGKE
jgi:membrane associated rhomboid family serine protease